jgi:hypothetical protein
MGMSDVCTVLSKDSCCFLGIVNCLAFCGQVVSYTRMGMHRLLFCARVISYARLCLYRPPSYWGTRNRSVDIGTAVQRSKWCATRSFVNALAETTGRALPFVQVGRRMQIDRFLVLQYEGGLHTPSRPYAAKLEQSSLDDHAAIASDIEATNREFSMPFTPLAQ